MLRTLYAKLALTLFALLLVLSIVFLAVNLISTRMFLREINQDLHRDLAAHLVKESLPIDNGVVQEEALEHIFHMLMVINPAIEVYLLDPSGALLSYSAPADAVVRRSVDLEPIRTFLSESEILPILGDDPRDATGQKVFSVAPVGTNESPDGYLYVILGGQQYDSEVAMLQGSHLLRLGLGIAVIALLLALATGLLLFSLITRRARRLSAAVEDFKNGGFATPMALDWRKMPAEGDEIHRLSRTFGEMSERMSEHLGELKRTDELRRELVANVSHDLRTPITSLRGYLETLYVKADTLSETERLEYIKIALKHSERLARLVSELFELAKLESCTTTLELEPFVLAELVQDAVQHFRLAADEKKIGLEANLPRELPRVVADVGLIARVLDNLLDNALRHTPDGGRVTVAIERHGDRLELRVEDTGPGIPPEHMPHLFERFFHHPLGEGRDHGGIGLGLAIAQKSLELHGSTLEVESEPGRGSCFAFDLAVDTA
jgi:signal transduction histidine kinase